MRISLLCRFSQRDRKFKNFFLCPRKLLFIIPRNTEFHAEVFWNPRISAKWLVILFQEFSIIFFPIVQHFPLSPPPPSPLSLNHLWHADYVMGEGLCTVPSLLTRYDMTSPLSPSYSAFVSKGEGGRWRGTRDGGGGRELDLFPTIPPTALLFKCRCGGRGRGLERKAKPFLDNKWTIKKGGPICIHSNVNLWRQLRKFAN